MKNIKGVTLVELIIGIVIIAVISIASLEFFRYCRRFIVDSEIRLGAVNFARETMELRVWDIDIEETTGTDWLPDTLLPTGEEGFDRIRDEYQGVREYKVNQTSDYKVIKVRVRWVY